MTHGRRLGAYLQLQTRTEIKRQMAEKSRAPEAVTCEIVVPPTVEPHA
jgi:uncharacterized membrane protein